MDTDALLAWYRQTARDLPWRRDPSPYYVLLSEFMCQQTRVETVIPYFERFVQRWPTLSDLAAASEEEVLGAWSGLGYYSRARNLHRCAQLGLPDAIESPEELQLLPGVGPYTAGALASISFELPVPVVDGNVERVLSRQHGLEADPRSGKGRRALWQLAADLVPESAPGDFNQALMELGARVCTPKAWRCDRCPVAASCVALATSRQAELPRKQPKPPPTPIWAVCGLLRRQGRWLLAQRTTGGRLGGLWEPVLARVDADRQHAEALVEGFRDRAGLHVSVGPDLGELVHVFTHRRLSVRVFEVALVSEAELTPGEGYAALRWLTDPEEVPLSALARKLCGLARQQQLCLR